MRILLTMTFVTFVTAACGSPTKKPVTADTDVAGENCCCKSNPLTSEDAKPVYNIGNRMECSSKQGECVADVQCDKQPEPE